MAQDSAFTTEDPCGQSLLSLVSRGNAIIAELLRLREYLPDVFRKDRKQEFKKYGAIIFDFQYFKTSDVVEAKLEADEALLKVDEEFKENYLEVISRFYVAYENIFKYITDLNTLVSDIKDGVYFQHTLENIFTDEDGRQLLCEALYLVGAQLLAAEQIDGSTRERLLVAYHRGSLRQSHCNLDDVCKLMRSTGRTEGRRPVNYPENYFSRLPVDAEYAALVVDHLRSGDIYSGLSHYPLPEHRSLALAPQAAMLYVTLYFRPDVLQTQTAMMREIVDKFFADNWLISVYMGWPVNLLEAWEPYRAARAVLQTCLDTAFVKQLSARHAAKLQELTAETEHWLREGVLTENAVLESWEKLMSLIRQCNSTLRWLLMHTSQLQNGSEPKRARQLRELVVAETHFEIDALFTLLLHSAQLELRCRQHLTRLLTDRDTLWLKEKEAVTTGLAQLATLFSGTATLTDPPKNERLEKWFTELAATVSSLSPSQESRRLLQIFKALGDVQTFHQLDEEAAVKQRLGRLRRSLRQMALLSGLHEHRLATLSVVTDFSYAWLLVDRLTETMQRSIRDRPALVAQLRATFLKLCSALDLPLLRINQAQSEDLASVSQHYSAELVAYLRMVVQVIPQAMFGLLDKIIDIETNQLKEVPTRLDKDKMKEFAQLPQRFEMARLTHAVSVLTDGVLAMETTLVGVVRLDPIQLLQDGVRQQLVRLMAETLHRNLIFSAKHKPGELLVRLTELARRMNGFRRSFEYIQDYVHLYGLRVWHEELTRIVNLNVEQECNSFLRTRIPEHQSRFQSRTVPIPLFTPTDKSITFIGRVAAQLLTITDPKTAVYLRPACTWYCLRSHEPVADRKLPALIASALGVAGLAGLDTLLGFISVTSLQKIVVQIGIEIPSEKSYVDCLNNLESSMPHGKGLLPAGSRPWTSATSRLQRPLASLLDRLCRVGQLALLRQSIAAHLTSAASFDSRNLVLAVSAMNGAVLTEPDLASDKLTPLLTELTQQLDWLGLSEADRRVYVSSAAPAYTASLLWLVLVACAPKLAYVRSLGGLSAVRASEPVDAAALVSGLSVLLGQLPAAVDTRLLQLLSMMVRSQAVSPPLPAETAVLLSLTEALADQRGVSLIPYFPEPLLQLYRGAWAERST